MEFCKLSTLRKRMIGDEGRVFLLDKALHGYRSLGNYEGFPVWFRRRRFCSSFPMREMGTAHTTNHIATQ